MPRRQRKSDLDVATGQLYAFLAAVPSWVGPLATAIGYSLFQFAIPAFYSGSEQPGATLAAMSKTLAPFVGGAMLAVWIAAEIKKFFTRRQFDACSDANSLRALDWREFETLIGEGFRRQGYAVAQAPPGPDGGVDLILTKNGERTFVQCKQWKSWNVGVETIRALYGVVAANAGVAGIVVCCGEYTNAAQEFAGTVPVQLIDGRALLRMVAEVKKGQRNQETHIEPAKPETRVPQPLTCPQCQSPMVVRTAKQGANAGSRFYGCSRFPICRGTRPATISC